MHTQNNPLWMNHLLRAAGVYNFGFCLLLTLYPSAVFQWLGMPTTPDLIIRTIGMMVGVYALAYWIAASDPMKYWPLVAVGIVGKMLGPIGFFHSVYTGILPWKAGTMILMNDLIWLPGFVLIFLYAIRREGQSWTAVLFHRPQK